MIKVIFSVWMLLAFVLQVNAGEGKENKHKGQVEIKVHAVTDLSHEFSFYGDHRFHQQYLPGQKGVTNWCSLFNFDFSNANLLILLSCADQIRYSSEDIQTIQQFLKAGGGVVILGDESGKSQNELANLFGVNFKGRATTPFKTKGKMAAGISTVEANGGSYMELQKPSQWETIIEDANGRPVLTRTKYGKGNLLIGARSIAGSNPNAKDSINYAMWRPLLIDLAAAKQIDPAKPFNSKGIDELEYKEDHGTFLLRYNDNLKLYANAMVDISKRCIPVIEKRMGVPLSQGMGSEIALLATGGGGFSSGKVIALAVWWGDFPKKEDSMIEFITHESVHSWVHPFVEIWNEPIATYVGNLVMIDMGHEAEAMRRIRETIAGAEKIDPEMKLYDIDGNHIDGKKKLEGGELRNMHWGKTFFLFEELRKEYPDVVSRYFQTKRKLALPDKIKEYDTNNTVAVMSVALGRDLFPWFRSHGFAVEREQAEIKF